MHLSMEEVGVWVLSNEPFQVAPRGGRTLPMPLDILIPHPLMVQKRLYAYRYIDRLYARRYTDRVHKCKANDLNGFWVEDIGEFLRYFCNFFPSLKLCERKKKT